MNEKNPIEHLLEQLEETVRTLTLKRKAPLIDKIPPEIYERIAKIREALQVLRDSSQQMNTGVSDREKAKNIVEIPESLNPETRQFLMRARQLQKEVNGLRMEFRLRTAQEARKKTSLSDLTSGKDQTGAGKSRKKRTTKNIGYKGWKRL